MKTNEKYYQIRENVSDYSSVGVIKVVNGVFPLESIQSAIESHLDEEIHILEIVSLGYNSDLRIHFSRDGGVKDCMEAEETWLFF